MTFDKEAPKEKDIGQIVRYLSNIFSQLTSSMEKPLRTNTAGANQLYKLQTEYCYLIHELTQGPKATQQKYITLCNEFLDSIMQSSNKRIKTSGT